MNRHVYVIGSGCISVAGFGPDRLDEAYRSSLRPHESAPWTEVAPSGQSRGAIDAFDPANYIQLRGLRPLSRASRLGVVAAAAALGYPDFAPEDPDRVGVVVGSRWGSIESIVDFNKSAHLDGPYLVNPSHFPNVVANVHAGYLGILFGLSGPNLTLCGASAGLEAIGQGVDLLETGRAGLVLAGGVEALGPSLQRGLSKSGRRERGAFPGEGAAFLLLTAGPPPGAVPPVRIMGWTVVTAHRESETTAAREQAVREVLPGSGMMPESVETYWSSGEDAEAFVAPPGCATRVRAVRAVTGNCEAADGAFAAALAVHQISHGAGPMFVGCFPPVGNQVVALFAPAPAVVDSISQRPFDSGGSVGPPGSAHDCLSQND